MDLDEIKRGLRAEIKKRENEQYFTFQCNVRQMCKDVLAKLEEQESEIADPKAQQQLDIVKDREMQRVANATAAETAKQKAITAKAEGDARIAQAKADQEVEKMTAVTQAQKEKDVAVLQAQKEQEVARLEALKALEVAKKIKAEKEAEAAANRALVSAGLTPQERAEWDYKTKVGVAEALAKSAHPLVPEIMLTGGESKGGSSSAMDAVGLNMLMNLTDRLSKK